jgi:hypothetical protein
MPRTRSLISLRASLLAAIGLGFSACGEDVTVDKHTSSGTTGSAGSGDVLPTACKTPTPIPAKNGAPSGFEKCADGTIIRAAVVAVDPTIDVPTCINPDTPGGCTTDADCTEGPHSRCVTMVNGQVEGTPTFCGCAYSCASDAECKKGEVCVDAGVVPSDQPWATCAPASCVTGKDCPSGECNISSFFDGCDTEVVLGCRSPTDECRVDADCAILYPVPSKCVLIADALTGAPDSAFRCSGTICDLGRPLLVDGRARTAVAAERGDWAAADPSVDTADLDPDTRATLSQHWVEVAALEHASVASFARFTLDLLATGAPPELLADAQRAGLDEIEHARLAYAFAGAYAGRRFGPGPLDLSSVTLSGSRRKVLRALVTEACVGETLGVAEALALARAVRDPALRGAHERIAEDEQRHAELGWRTLAWLLEGADDSTARFAARCFDEAMEVAARDPSSSRARVAKEHGLLAARDIGAIRRQAIREVIAPCAGALLRRCTRRGETISSHPSSL